jgi:ubiquinone/menaquinone biosynthesis C-methylase UbiE
LTVADALEPGSIFEHGRNRIAHRLLLNRKISPLLDYGCGTAEFALAFARERGVEVHACDIDEVLVERLREQHGGEAHFFAVSDEAPRLELADGQVAVVTCCDVLEHMPPQLRISALTEMRRVLADDGSLIVTTPHRGLFSLLDPENVKYHFPRAHRLIFTLLKGREEYGRRFAGERFGNFSRGAARHVHFSAEELRETLAEAGFTVEEVRYFTLVYPFAKTLLWFAESAAGRVPGARRLTAIAWRIYIWDADLEPGPLAGSIGLRASKA